ncbi:hypothetical protein pkur_cds_7 [Pandoravirus kuranda]|uniref:Uncharacterized protein n=1 Tax=Pandoravirus kuranda TaxID=3019033 RepID=A0AA95ECG1_9VIRU|nr:hypothetical protein pkur_cds_7 [Pandoravirus kuranda]
MPLPSALQAFAVRGPPEGAGADCPPGRKEDTDAVLDAIARQDVAAIRRILAQGRVDVNDLIDSDRIRYMGFNADTTARLLGRRRPVVDEYGGGPPMGTIGAAMDEEAAEAPTLDLLVPATVRRPVVSTLLQMAVASGAPASVEALIDAGALPWPTREALLNQALALSTAVDYEYPRGAPRRIDAARTARVLLHRFGRSPRLDPLDSNPLSVARLATLRGVALAPELGAALGRAVEANLVPLLAAGYRPDERVQGVGRPLVDIGDALSQADLQYYDLGKGWRRLYGTPAAYNLARAGLSRITEREALARDLERASDMAARPRYDVEDHDALADYMDHVARALARVSSLYDAQSPPPADGSSHLDADQEQGGEEEEEGETGGDIGGDEGTPPAQLSLLETLPVEVVQAIALSRGLSARDLAALYGTSRALAEATQHPLAARRAVFEAYRRPGAPCGDYSGCLSALVEAISLDDVDDAQRALDARVVSPDSLVDPGVAQAFGNPAPRAWSTNSARWRPPTRLVPNTDINRRGALHSASRVGVDLRDPFLRGPRGWPYATPLMLAAMTKAPRVVDQLARAGATPWPSVEAVMHAALQTPFDERVAVVSDAMTGPGALEYDLNQRAPTAALRQAYSLPAEKRLPWVQQVDPTVSVVVREGDTADVVRAITNHYERSARLHPGDINPLTALRLYALGGLPTGNSSWMPTEHDRRAVIATLSPLVETLLAAGYSPDERALPCDVDPQGITERASAARLTRRTFPQSLQGTVARLFDGAYAAIPSLSPSSSSSPPTSVIMP